MTEHNNHTENLSPYLQVGKLESLDRQEEIPAEDVDQIAHQMNMPTSLDLVEFDVVEGTSMPMSYDL